MKVDCIIIGLLWALSFTYADFVSRLFEPLLLLIVVLSGICYGLTHYSQSLRLSAKKRVDTTRQSYTLPNSLLSIIHGLSAYFLPFLLLFVSRSFVVDVSRVVSGSLKPTVLVGDTILVNKYRYGIRLPIKGNTIIPISDPERGDIISFRLPRDRSKIFIKRVIGLPGDRIEYRQKQLVINGKPITQSVLGLVQDEKSNSGWTMIQSEEDLLGKKHAIYVAFSHPLQLYNPSSFSEQSDGALSVIVPNGHYFVMGDNRDNSLDSRHWGFVPSHCLLGKVHRVIISWDSLASWGKPLTWLRWERLGMQVV